MKKFQPDIQEVDQFGFIDLRSAYMSGSISGDMAVTSSENFNEASPDSMLHRPSDAFEARRQRQYVRDTLAAQAAAAKESEAAASE